jgi:hypothetical protein
MHIERKWKPYAIAYVQQTIKDHKPCGKLQPIAHAFYYQIVCPNFLLRKWCTETVCTFGCHCTPLGEDGLVNRVQWADSAVCEGMICTSVMALMASHKPRGSFKQYMEKVGIV